MNGHGSVRVQDDVFRPVWRQKTVHFFLVKDFYGLHTVGDDHPFKADSHGQKDPLVFSHAVGLNNHIVGFLGRLRVNLDPPRIPLIQRIAEIRADGGGCADGSVNHGHNHREAKPRGHKKVLMHIDQPLGRTGRKGPCPCCLSRNGNCHGRVLRFYGHELRIQFPTFNERGHLFHNVGLRGNWIDRYHFHPGQPGPMGCRVVSGQHLSLFHDYPSPSASTTMAPAGHSFWHIPQPLQ